MNIETTTKEKILNVANKLFAKHGFYGTSVRDIATEAQVNVASINYHFKNKENLYFESYQRCYDLLDKEVQYLAETISDTAQLAWKIFEMMMGNGSAIVNAFKIILNDDFEFPEEQIKNTEKNYGPPGGEALFSALSKEFPQVSEGAKIWAVRGIFTYLAHWALMMNTKYCQQISASNPDFSMEEKERDIKMHVEATLEYILNHPNNFN